MGTVLNAINNRIAARSDLNKIASAKAQLAHNRELVEKCAQHLPVIQAYLEKHGLGLGSLREALAPAGHAIMNPRESIGRLGALGLESPRTANAIGAGALGAGVGGLEQGLQDEGNVGAGIAAGAGIGAGGMAGAQRLAGLIGKSKRISEALKLRQAFSGATDIGGELAAAETTGIEGARPGLGSRMLGGIGAGAKSVETATPMKRVSEGMVDIGQGPARAKAKAENKGRNETAKSEHRKGQAASEAEGGEDRAHSESKSED